MRQLRILKQGVWYEIRTRVNNREPLFRGYKAPAIFARVFRETELQFVFEIRGLRLEDDWLTFYIKPADGLELPAIWISGRHGNCGSNAGDTGPWYFYHYDYRN